MRKISANYIIPVISPPIKNGILIFDNFNTIIEIKDCGNNFSEQANLEFYNGVLVPVFVKPNTAKSNYINIKNEQQILDIIFAALNNNPVLKFEELLAERTLEKAKFLKCEDKLGSFEIGKSPGVNLITPFDFQKFTIKKESIVKRLV